MVIREEPKYYIIRAAKPEQCQTLQQCVDKFRVKHTKTETLNTIEVELLQVLKEKW